jgi:DNA-binding transcriptional ArsR family regulator
MSTDLRFHVLQILQIAHKDGLSIDEINRRIGMPVEFIGRALAQLENQGFVISALVDDNSPFPRRIFHLSRQARRSLTADP